MKKMNISDAELELLKELWVESPLTSRQLVDRLQVRTQWGEPTIKTLLLRLLRKKAVKRQSQGKSFLYSAAIRRDEYQYTVSRSVIDRLFDGLAGNFLTCLVRNESFRPGELEELRRLLDEKAAAQDEQQPE
ncbi:MAG TPA: CopY family transcriptional repressor [Lentisphaeria bacterium]|jgi:transcriptional repressor, copY family|uniref:BlaI/MecI/CopY family transcriptional regulator n=2 Tax=Victivallis lenta TaxID=2606640 RepID=UPI000D043B42|nr:BlaI/MecI/CopY family transcriptional regulator [Victivallis lenta]AVM43277.1 CopY family transcriptional repressor [Victivallales bacterium CCUG 44730]MBS1454578.1 CopY family transcriptional repressor [Lentisphaeria bacterium]MBS5530478.1 BlaI/MecI/CopY family transcriptional regulator [bacterium]HBP07638.1 CopY family transcriptional repressor [Lentisphaeria bacterium]HCH85199.1 CopY family transcriptional repressor [Lentisphaeria bacterium]